MTADEIRDRFVSFFEQRGHEHVASSSLVPGNDPTLLFANAGMNQFKGVFLGRERRTNRRAVSVQKCVRAGGKHNDLENVGRTARHHTFFEMLGNFSFGEYFKEEAIGMAWEFVTRELGLPAGRLLVTVYAEDEDAYRIWHQGLGLPAEQIIRIATSDNFWSMGPTGPCGPCSEIFYDHGPDIFGGPPGSPDQDGDRFVEIWNLVFMQYDRGADGTLVPLPHPCIDTGAGLERLAVVLQGRTNNYDSDLFQPLMQAAARLTGCAHSGATERGAGVLSQQTISLQVIADHVRAVSFLIADGVLPSNEGRGYVLRRIMRRAMRHGRLLGLEEPFLFLLVPTLVEKMGRVYPELIAQQRAITSVVENEEKRFVTTLGSGMKLLEGVTAGLQAGDRLGGEMVFTLYDTYGFPVDLTADILRDRGIELDLEGFDQCMARQKAMARAAWSGSGDAGIAAVFHEILAAGGPVTFVGYEQESARGRIRAIINLQGGMVATLAAGEEGGVVCDRTPFYGESGGQVGDTGWMTATGTRFEVTESRRPVGELVVHYGRLLQGGLAVGDEVALQVDGERRQAVRWHHSATHLLHHALKKVLGDHVKQAGSLVGPERLRFDYSHYQAMTSDELERVEGWINQWILANHLQETAIMTPEEAIGAGAMALFGEKYGERVRVVRLGPSMELCGGTHVSRTGDIGLLRIVSESAVASGVRRIEGVCGERARESYQQDARLLQRIAGLLKLAPADAMAGVEKLLARRVELERELEKSKAALAGSTVDELLARVREKGGIRYLVARVTDVDAKGLRDLADRLRDRLVSGVILLGVPEEGKVSLLAGVTRDLTGRCKAGDLMQVVAPVVGGKGGGRPDMAMGGGTRPEALQEALAVAAAWIEEKAG
ncbi:MAG: alanine--tRNA ligase [Magnetococcales bacterium]|nr:alanine--tRNA ligase [Magnetococcales bacterium]